MPQYAVQPGDNPTQIAKKFGMTLAQFQRANPGLCEYGTNRCKVLFPGQLLNVAAVAAGQPTDVPVAQPVSFNAPPPWMQIAIMEQGVQEWGAGKDNPRILEYLTRVGIGGGLLEDETAWCAAFTYWCLWKAGYPGQRSGRVSDWWGWGRPVAATYGAVCILQPLAVDQASSGHIGFLHAMDANNVWLLSGNSANQVRISAYPKSKLIQNSPYRWPF